MSNIEQILEKVGLTALLSRFKDENIGTIKY